ncbi:MULTISPECIES: hypothetical protein [Streptomyces]|uniref:hypothetical protein n=1 Tax=Streptomyces TaxID=1883 RepID=UPI000C27F1DA|nr:hypothetical protein [Streptomyces sp. CB01201]MBX7472432.1 hypothetical protein [Streptomyces sp. MAG02]PJM99667.1 hypothetical protein CG740_29505 [Streptomyces sp. CB01201]
MARHRKCATPVPLDRARRRLAAGLTAVSALAATFLAAAVTPAAPPAPDRAAAAGSDLAQASGK